MRSKLAAVAIGLGVFMIVAAVLVRAYAYPTLATVPADYKGTTYLEAKGAQVLDWESIQKPGPLVSETHDLAIQSFTIADTGAKAPDGVVVWVNSTTVMQDDGTQFQRTQERAPFDGVSGAAVDCASCESWTSDTAVYDGQERVETPLERQGQVYKFPFGTEKKSYDVWDGTLGEATPAKFEGTEKVDGLEVYKFVQTIEPTMVGTQELSGTKFGAADPANVEAELWYSMTRTFYVEPQTGSPVNRTEERMQELRYDGVAVPVFNGTVQYTAQQVKDLVNGTKDQTGAKDNAMLLGGLRLLFPLLLVLVGAALLVGGLFLGRKARSERDVKADEKPLVNA
ncbi:MULTISPECIES: DUF3068 domain-containing protein [unclassified Nocardioides]|jgi:hypothetical protein|uniref:DUF3068 domain-containing protein n=1 Tax=unclassified Nocardioides TaxID=2615069 RepID=UPI000702D50B|nr:MULTISPECIES: DUF3068 domain-containing protein [unclassified Nocardioides]KRC56626.1 hypothetical protein ASE19_01980 [Nocardioides sp. Root79]KRC76837.1 hypothetical protein ASE20_00850 [Nocardioides sp. Root240]